MRVLVTGGAGFIGSHLVDLLLMEGHQVTIMDLCTPSLVKYNPKVKVVRGDVRESLDELFASERPEVVVHLAAQVSVPKSVEDPACDMAINATGVVNLLETCSRYKVRKVVALSSAAVYGQAECLPITEDAPARPLSPYGLSKLTGEAYLRMLGELRGISYTILRPANVYGSRQLNRGEGAVVPAFLSRFLSQLDPTIDGDGSHTRDFIHVSDVVKAIASAMHKADGLTLNISTNTATTINDIWHLLAVQVGWERPPLYGAGRGGDIPHSVMANDRACLNLDWKPQVPLEQGLQETVSWALRAVNANMVG